MNTDQPHPLRSPQALLLFLGTTVVGLSADLLLKSWAVQHLRNQEPIDLIPHLLRLTYTENPGAVFGIGEGRRFLFILVSVAAIVFLGYLFADSGKRRFYQLLLGMLLAGVLGNMYDRIFIGYVRDMIYGLPGVTWPRFISAMLPARFPREVYPWVFNIADSLLCIGVLCMVFHSFRQDARPRASAEAAAEI